MGGEELECFYKHRMKKLGLDSKKYPMPIIEEYGARYLYVYTGMLAEYEHYKKLNKKYNKANVLSYISFIVSLISLLLIMIGIIISMTNN